MTCSAPLAGVEPNARLKEAEILHRASLCTLKVFWFCGGPTITLTTVSSIPLVEILVPLLGIEIHGSIAHSLMRLLFSGGKNVLDSCPGAMLVGLGSI